jgi:hypothetical protein
MPRTSPETAAAAHVAQIVRSARALFVVGATIEDCLSAILEAARQEFHLSRVLVRSPARLIVDGNEFQWPAAVNDSAKKLIAFEDVSNQLRGGRASPTAKNNGDVRGKK